MKKILILGGSSDIGLSLVKILSSNQNNLIHLHYFKKKIEQKYSKNIKLIKADFSKIQNNKLKKIFDKDYDVIINLIGYINNISYSNFNFENFFKTIRINCVVPLMIIRNSLKNMVKKKYGRIINTSSVGIKFGGGNNTFVYSLSKHINEFIPSHIRNLCKSNVFYNVLRIGLTDTKMHLKIKRKLLKKRIKLVPVQKIASTEDIAKYINFFVSDNNFITNEIVNITGGE